MQSRAFLYGDSVFETVRVDATPVRLQAHIDRAVNSMQFLEYPQEFIEQAVKELHALHGKPAGVYRLTFVRPSEGAPFGGTGGEVVVERRDPPERKIMRLGLAKGWYLPDDVLAEHKTSSYLRCVEVMRRAQAAGFDDALKVAHDGRIGETSTANIFLRLGGKWVTPPVEGILPGTTRQTLVDSGIVSEARVFIAELESAQAVALTSSTVDALGVSVVGELSFETGLEHELNEVLQ